MSALKKIFIVSSVIFGVALIFWGIYNFAFQNLSLEKGSVSKNDKEEEKLPSPESKKNDPELEKRIKDISGEGVVAPIFKEEENKVFFYAARDGKVFSMSPDGAGKSVFSSQALGGFSGAKWSPDRKKVISEFDGGARRYFYDYGIKSGKPLKGGIADLAWSNLGDRILYQYRDGKINELDSADPDGGNWKKITDIRAADAKIAPIPGTSLVTFWNRPKNAEETGLLSVSIIGGEVKKIFGGRYGADYLWAPDGKKGLVSFSEAKGGSKMSLGVINNDGTNFRDLKIPTLVSKCAWSKDGQTVFFSVPGGIPEGAVMPDDYLAKKFQTQDTFWKVDLKTGEQTRLIELEDLSRLGQGLDAENLFLPDNEKNLFFVNRTDGHLFRLSLVQKK